MTPASEHLAHARAIRLEAPAQRQGAGCRNFSRLPARGGAFSLDILFYRTEGNLAVDKGQESVIGDGNSVRVAGQVLKHMLRPSEGAFGIDHPVLAEEWSKECVEAFSLASGWRLPGKTSLP